MYVIIEKATDSIVAVTEEIRYTKTQSNGCTVATNQNDATAVYVADSDTFWSFVERYPGDKTYRVEAVSSIPDDIPSEALSYEDGTVSVDVEKYRELKLAEVSADCNSAIVAGCSVELSDGTAPNFALEETDQINLTAAATAVTMGATGYPYHADGELCKLYSAEDIMAISTAATTHKLYHTTYCNHLLVWIRRAEDADELAGITYGVELPEDLAENMAEVLADETPE